MPHTPSKYTGTKTRPAQQRLNRKNSKEKLFRLLNLNFPDGAVQITLTYRHDGYIPTGKYVTPDVYAWVRASRNHVCGEFRYIRIVEDRQENGRVVPVHHVITDAKCKNIEDIAAIWPFGPFRIEEIAPEQFYEWAGKAVTAGKTGAFWTPWVTSRNLKRP